METVSLSEEFAGLSIPIHSRLSPKDPKCDPKSN
jgi:hypothetical protein